MEGGVRVGSFSLLEGQSATGKSVICQYVATAALHVGLGVAYFTSQLTSRSLESQMSSMGLEAAKYFQAEKIRVYPLQEPITGEDSGTLLAALALEMERLQQTQNVIVVDAITDLASPAKNSL